MKLVGPSLYTRNEDYDLRAKRKEHRRKGVKVIGGVITTRRDQYHMK
jgi:hypothetical protein